MTDSIHLETAPGVEIPKDFTTTAPLDSGFVPYDLVGQGRKPRDRTGRYRHRTGRRGAHHATAPGEDDEGERRRPIIKAEPRWPGWRHDRELAAHYERLLHDNDRRVAVELVKLAIFPTVKAAQPGPSEESKRTAETLLAGWLGRLKEILHNLWTEGWFLGRRSATALATASPVDWGTWTPGDPYAAAQLLHGDVDLQRLLNGYGVRTIQSVYEHRRDDLARLLYVALEEGETVEASARRIEDTLAAPHRARMIAHTELARATSQASLTQYRQSDLVTGVEWSTADDARVCKVCDANEDHGPVATGSPFPSGQDAPPGHPTCRCALVPAFDWLGGPVEKAGVPRAADTPGEAGSAERLRQYWEHGEGAAQIGWGTHGDFDRCVELVVEHAHMSPERARGYCNLRHHGALGYYPATHAAMERGHKLVDASELGVVKLPDESTRAIADDVYTLLSDGYPDKTLQWVHDAVWTGPRDVPLSTIDLGRRPGGRDPAKVRGIERQLAERGPRSFEPVVLVDTRDAEKFAIADGYHRALAFQHAGQEDIRAYVGTVGMETGPWDRAMHDAKLNKTADSEIFPV